MSHAALEVNDVGLVLRWSGGGSEPSPGCALIENGTLVTGQAAAARSRLLPRHAHDRFWFELGTEALPPPFPAGLSAADLAHEQLGATLRESGRDFSSLILAVPGSFTSHQLGLLLGISRSLPVRVCGLVDAALAAGRAAAAPERSVHVDIELHRCVVTELHVGERVSRGRISVTDGAGFSTLRSNLARRISSLFVERTRFDPLTSAPAEQQLFALLPALARATADSAEGHVELETSEGAVAIDVDSSELIAAARSTVDAFLGAVRPLLQGRTRTLVSDRAAAIPGLAAALAELSDDEPTLLPPEAGAAGALAAREHLETEGEALPFVVNLPLRDGDDSGPAT